jgi:deoxyribose-phosphate aldolase
MEINRFIDHTLLKPVSTPNQIKTICEEAKKYNFFSVCINPHYVSLASDELKGSEVKVCTVVGFPLGANTTEIKVAETLKAIEDGANEIDMVINIGELKNKNEELITEDIKLVVDACHERNVLCKVIIETCLLDQEEKLLACKAVSNAKADYIKTSTGFGGGGATVEDVKLMKENVTDGILVKASGGVRDLDSANAMIEAGASRLGASSGVAIMEGLKSTENY